MRGKGGEMRKLGRLTGGYMSCGSWRNDEWRLDVDLTARTISTPDSGITVELQPPKAGRCQAL